MAACSWRCFLIGLGAGIALVWVLLFMDRNL